MNRRELLKASAWAVPVVAATIAAPVAAASEVTKPSRIVFTNLTATEGRHPNTVYFNTKVMVVEGPDAVESLEVTVTVVQGNETYHPLYHYSPTLPGWGATSTLRGEQSGLDKVHPIRVVFEAKASNAETIRGEVTLQPPGWWA